MELFELPKNLQDESIEQPEQGMGFQIVQTNFGQFTRRNGILVCGLYFLPDGLEKVADSTCDFRDEYMVSLDVLEPTIRKPSESGLFKSGSLLVLSTKKQVKTAGAVVKTPPFQTTTIPGDIFYRLSAYKNDRRIMSSGGLAPGSYATTNNDLKVVPSGLAAVGRYALPSRLPAVYVFVITPSPGTPVSYGTVTPDFGMCGGGVEAYFPRGTNAGSVRYLKQIDMK